MANENHDFAAQDDFQALQMTLPGNEPAKVLLIWSKDKEEITKGMINVVKEKELNRETMYKNYFQSSVWV